MGKGVFLIESVWDDDIHSTQSVRPFVEGLTSNLGVSFGYRNFHSRSNLVSLLKAFINSTEYSICYIAGHGTGARLGGENININFASLAKDLSGTRRVADKDAVEDKTKLTKKGILLGACEVGIASNEFINQAPKAINWVAGYNTTVPWFESTVCDIMFMKYVLVGIINVDPSITGSHLTNTKKIKTYRTELDILKLRDYLHEDFPMSKAFGFDVF